VCEPVSPHDLALDDVLAGRFLQRAPLPEPVQDAPERGPREHGVAVGDVPVAGLARERQGAEEADERPLVRGILHGRLVDKDEERVHRDEGLLRPPRALPAGPDPPLPVQAGAAERRAVPFVQGLEVQVHEMRGSAVPARKGNEVPGILVAQLVLGQHAVPTGDAVGQGHGHFFFHTPNYGEALYINASRNSRVHNVFL